MRVKRAAINSTFSIIQKLVETILAFIYRTIFIQVLGVEYLGVSGLFTNIFSVFSLMELGVGSSIVFLMYEPLAKNNTEEVKTYMRFYSNMYKVIAIVILVLGIVLIPFLPYVINGETDIPDLVPIYVLILLNSVASYLFSYKRSILEADQKAYYNSINYSIFNIISTISRIIILLTTKNYLACLVIFIIVTLSSNITISLKVNKLYPYLKEKNILKMDKKQKKEVIKRMKTIMMHKVGNIAITSTDNIIISAFISVIVVGIYSNYYMITNILYTTVSLIFVSITASVGNLKVTETNEKAEKVYNEMFLLNYFFYFVICITSWSIFNDFITIWLGTEFLLSPLVVALIIIQLYVSGMRHTPVTFINSSGLNYNSRFKPLVEAIINIVVSIIGAKLFGIAGVIIGTISAYVLCSVWIEPKILYKHWFKTTPRKYFIKYFMCFVFVVLSAIITKNAFSGFVVTGWISLFVKALCIVITTIAIFVLFFYRTKEFKYYMEIINGFKNNIINKLKRRKINEKKLS